ncbi:MAG: glutathione peroxidase [Nannocystaceae bacterium]
MPPLLLVLALTACDSTSTAKTDATPDAKAAAAKTDAAPSDAKAEAPADPSAEPAEVASGPVLDHTVKLLDGSDKSLTEYRGKALLVVNTASECGYTPQYAGLQELYAKYKERGLEVLAFPSNDFGGQEPGTPEQIRSFVDTKYSVEFEMFDKVQIKGSDKSPLYQTLTEQTADGIKGDVGWNFTKFLVDPEGHVVARFDSAVDPMSPELLAELERVLPKA